LSKIVMIENLYFSNTCKYFPLYTVIEDHFQIMQYHFIDVKQEAMIARMIYRIS